MTSIYFIHNHDTISLLDYLELADSFPHRKIKSNQFLLKKTLIKFKAMHIDKILGTEYLYFSYISENWFSSTICKWDLSFHNLFHGQKFINSNPEALILESFCVAKMLG